MTTTLIDLYQFHIEGTPKRIFENKKFPYINAERDVVEDDKIDTKLSMMFQPFANVRPNECKIITPKVGFDANKEDFDFLTSCDLVGGTHQIIKDYYRVYKNTYAIEHASHHRGDATFPKVHLEKIISSAEKLKAFIYHQGEDILSIDVNDENRNNMLFLGGYYCIVNVPERMNVIVIGDLHGSFHTFFRIIIRLMKVGIIDPETFRLHPKYMIVFLGDIVCYGAYSMLIINLIMEMMIANNTLDELKVIYNRGNHESNRYFNGLDGVTTRLFYRELQYIYNFEEVDRILTALEYFYKYCPSAIILNHHGRKIALAHSYIRNDLVVDVPNKQYTLKSYTKKVNEWDTFREGMRIDYPNNRGEKLSEWKTKEKILEIMRKSKIDFIFRGHDDFESSFRLISLPDEPKTYNIGSVDIDEKYSANPKGDRFIYYNPNHVEITNPTVLNNPSNRAIAVHGAIARIRCDDNFVSNYYNLETQPRFLPVLTLSTATDYLKSLPNDSFAIIRYDCAIEDATNFNVNQLVDDRNSMSIVLEGGGCYKKLYEKYKAKHMEQKMKNKI